MPGDADLLALLRRIFADNVVTADERDELLDLQSELAPKAVQGVFAAFVAEKWGEALADGVITRDEQLALRRVVEELQVPEADLPPRLRLALRAR